MYLYVKGKAMNKPSKNTVKIVPLIILTLISAILWLFVTPPEGISAYSNVR